MHSYRVICVGYVLYIFISIMAFVMIMIRLIILVNASYVTTSASSSRMATNFSGVHRSMASAASFVFPTCSRRDSAAAIIWTAATANVDTCFRSSATAMRTLRVNADAEAVRSASVSRRSYSCSFSQDSFASSHSVAISILDRVVQESCGAEEIETSWQSQTSVSTALGHSRTHSTWVFEGVGALLL
jgi:hypothetical protein